MTTTPTLSAPAAQVDGAELSTAEHCRLDIEIRIADLARELPQLIADSFTDEGKCTPGWAAVRDRQRERHVLLNLLAAIDAAGWQL